MFDTCTLGLAPFLLGAQVARNVGVEGLAQQYCSSALDFHKNQVLLYHAHMQLGELLALPRI